MFWNFEKLTEGYLIKNKNIIKTFWFTHYLNHLKNKYDKFFIL